MTAIRTLAFEGSVSGGAGKHSEMLIPGRGALPGAPDDWPETLCPGSLNVVFHTPEAGGKVSRVVETQVGRALTQLGIEHIAAYSPEARGRSERAFRTLQDRLPKELALAGVTTVEAANRRLAETYIPQHNAAFAVEAEQEGSAFVLDRAELWRDILCIHEERAVGNDNTIKWRRLSLQPPPSRLRPHFVRARVRVNEYPDGTIAVFLGPHRLATYSPDGQLSTSIAQAA